MRFRSRLKLLAAGWYPNRNVFSYLELPQGFELFPEAKRILSEYGNLRICCSEGEVAELNPMACETVDLLDVVRDVRPTMYPIGLCVGHVPWAIAVCPDKTTMFVFDIDDVVDAGNCFEAALDELMSGKLRGATK